MMESTRDLNRLSWLIFDQGLDMSLGLLNVGRLSGDLDGGLAATLARNVDRDLELRFETSLDFTATADQGPMLLNRHFQNFCDLAFALGHDGLDLGNDLVDDLAAALYLDGVSIGILLGELDSACKLPPIIRTACLEDDVTEV
jgi:hypothetical protein